MPFMPLVVVPRFESVFRIAFWLFDKNVQARLRDTYFETDINFSEGTACVPLSVPSLWSKLRTEICNCLKNN